MEQVKEQVQQFVSGSELPNKDYKSTVKTYGSSIRDIGDRLVAVYDGIMPTIDRVGDWQLRQVDDHAVSNPTELFPKLLKRKHFSWAFKLLNPGPKRSRGTTSEIQNNIKRLSLDEYYEKSEEGIEIKKRDIFEHGIALQDIWKAEQTGSDILLQVDRIDALTKATEYIRLLHERANGGVGEILPSDILFQNIEQDPLTNKFVVSNPVLNIPDIVFHEGKKVPADEQKAIDLIDMIFSNAVEELEKTADYNEVWKVISTIIYTYDDPEVIQLVEVLIKRGRLSIAGMNKNESFFKRSYEKFTQLHNATRLRVPTDDGDDLRQLVAETCHNYVEEHKRDVLQTTS